MDPSPTKIVRTLGDRQSDDFIEEWWLFLQMPELRRQQKNVFKNHGLLPEMFGEQWIFGVEPTTIALLPQSTYRATIEIDSPTQQLQPQTCLVDTGSGHSLIRKGSLKKEWVTNIKKQQLRQLHTETKEPISLDGTVLLFDKFGEFRVRVWFGIDKNYSLTYCRVRLSSKGIY